MDYKNRYQSQYTQVRELNDLVADCREMALHLGFMLSWRIRQRTATAYIKFSGGIIWKAEYTGRMPHSTIINMYCGLHEELVRRVEENRKSIEQMRLAEEERQREREIMNKPDWRAGRG